MSFESPESKKQRANESEEQTRETTARKFEQPQREPVEAIIASDTEELGALWSNIPEDLKSSPEFFDLAEGYKGDVEAYVASQREWYKKQGVDQYWGDFQIKEKLQRLRDRAVGTLGAEEAKKLVGESRLRQQEEKRKTADSGTQEKLKQIRKDIGIEEKENGENLFDKLKREYGVDDVKAMQQAFAAFEKMREKERGQYVLGDNQFYQFLTSGELADNIESPAAKAMEAEKDADPKDYEKLILGFYESWQKNLQANKKDVLVKRPRLQKTFDLLDQIPQPKNNRELRELYRKNPELNEISAVSYQDGFGGEEMQNNPFLHFQSHRKDGYTYESTETEVRLYLNPPKEALPQVANKFIELAESEGVPYYFKLIDFSLQKPTRSDTQRMDRMVFYADKESGTKIAKLLQKISDENPEWFKGRPLPQLVAEVASGIGAAEEPSEFQNKKFSRLGKQNTSFSEVRAKFLRNVWESATEDILVLNPDIKPRGRRTLREIFNDLIPTADKKYTDKIWQSGFDQSKLDERGKRVLKDATLRLMADVMPNISPDSLMPYINEEIKRKAKDYGINPENLAFNL